MTTCSITERKSPWISSFRTTPNSPGSLVRTFGCYVAEKEIPASRWRGSVGARFESVSTSGCGPMADPDDALYKSRLLSGLVRQRKDIALRKAIEDFGTDLDFEPLEDLMISESAWQYATAAKIDPRFMFRPSVSSAKSPRNVAILPRHGAPIAETGTTVGRVGVELGIRVTQERSRGQILH